MSFGEIFQALDLIATNASQFGALVTSAYYAFQI